MLLQLAGYYSRHGPRWEDTMLASYRTLNPQQATWFDANPTIEAELLARLQPGGYLYTTFGPGGQNKTACDFVFLLLAVGDVVERAIIKSGATLRWDIDGTVTTQNSLPAHTLGAGAGIITCSSTDGWTGITLFQIFSSLLSGVLPFWVFPNITNFIVNGNSFTGTPPLWDFPEVIDFQAAFCQFSGTAPAWNFQKATTFRINHNQYADVTAPLPNLTAVSNLQVNVNGLSQAAVDAALLAIYNNRLNYTNAAPALQIHGSNAAPSGTYQANCPTAQTGKEYQYHLVNDPCADGHNRWTITAST